ncbi:MAG: CRISPR-associated endonuclease Cas3'' [Oscillospiraceae bacterium]|nr:CRISPR-associated endonuclease Cas3'' [Oscillospiraceae bacterium]
MKQKEIFIAHSHEDCKEYHSLLNHLHGAAESAGKFAEKFGCGELAKSIALAHDIGKYSIKFQKRIRGVKLTVDHSTPGGQLIWGKNNSP